MDIYIYVCVCVCEPHMWIYLGLWLLNTSKSLSRDLLRRSEADNEEGSWERGEHLLNTGAPDEVGKWSEQTKNMDPRPRAKSLSSCCFMLFLPSCPLCLLFWRSCYMTKIDQWPSKWRCWCQSFASEWRLAQQAWFVICRSSGWTL